MYEDILGATARLADESAIRRCLFEYARAVDRLDLEGVQDCYTSDGYDQHGGYSGDIDGLLEDMRHRHASIDSSQHYITNVMIEFEEAGARVESYCLCYLRQASRADDGTQVLSVIRCRYLDWFVKTEAGWKIAERVVAFDERRELAILDTVDPSWVISTHGADIKVPSSWGV